MNFHLLLIAATRRFARARDRILAIEQWIASRISSMPARFFAKNAEPDTGVIG